MEANALMVRRYRPLELLGEGGMGSAWKVLDRLTDDVVVMKRPHTVTAEERPGSTPSMAYDKTMTADSAPLSDSDTVDGRTMRGRLAIASEFRLLAGLRHPNIISVLDYGFDPQLVPWFTMELVTDDVDIAAAAKTVPLQRRVRLLLQTLDALVYLHRRGVVHRDIKPSNIMVAQDRIIRRASIAGESSGRSGR